LIKYTNFKDNQDQCKIANLALTIVRGLNQIVDMNQKSKFALSFKFILRKIYFEADTIDFVSEMRHAIIHKDFPSSENIKRLGVIVLSWCFLHFWQPLLKNNLKKFSSQRLQMLMPYFCRGVNVTSSEILNAFDSHRLGSIEERGYNKTFVSLFFVDNNLFESTAFKDNVKNMVNMKISKKKKAICQNDLFEIKEIEEEEEEDKETDQKENSISTPQNETPAFIKLKICLSPTNCKLKRYTPHPV
jgi:hypothetical protein